MTKPSLSQETKEDLATLLDSTTGKFVIDLAVNTVRDQRKALLTSPSLTERERFTHLGRVAGMHALIKALFESSGREIPNDLERYFTGDS